MQRKHDVIGWSQYSKLKAELQTSEKQRPSVIEYLGIKIVDNCHAVLALALTLFFALLATFLRSLDIDIYTWFLDAAKLCLGVFLGILTRK